MSSAVAPALALPASAHLLSAIFNVARSNLTSLNAAAAVLAAFHDLAILDAARPTVAIPNVSLPAIPDVSLPSAILDAALSIALPSAILDAALSMAIPDVAHLTMAILDAALSSAISDATLSIMAILNVAFSFRIFFAPQLVLRGCTSTRLRIAVLVPILQESDLVPSLLRARRGEVNVVPPIDMPILPLPFSRLAASPIVVPRSSSRLAASPIVVPILPRFLSRRFTPRRSHLAFTIVVVVVMSLNLLVVVVVILVVISSLVAIGLNVQALVLVLVRCSSVSVVCALSSRRFRRHVCVPPPV